MAVTAGNKILATDISDTLTKVNAARTKFGLGSTSLTNTAVGNAALSVHLSTLKTALNQAITAAGAPYNTNTVIAYSVGDKKLASNLDTLQTVAVNVQNYCPCNCNYSPCSCDYETCSCNYSCTCNCNYSCGCDYSCTCNCNYSCSCNSDYCSGTNGDVCGGTGY